VCHDEKERRGKKKDGYNELSRMRSADGWKGRDFKPDMGVFE
jgi:hypothetical protein